MKPLHFFLLHILISSTANSKVRKVCAKLNSKLHMDILVLVKPARIHYEKQQ